MIKFVLAFLFIFSTFADLSVRMEDEDDPEIFLRDSDGTTIEIVTEATGDGTSESSAFVAYIPIESSANMNQDAQHYFKESFDVPDKSDTSAGLSFSLSVDNNSDSSQQLMVAIKTDTDEYTSIAEITSSNFVSYSQICSASSSSFDCDNFDDDDEQAEVLLYIVYIDSGTSGDDTGEDFNPSESGYDNGFFIELNISADVQDYLDGDTAVSSISAARGDSNIEVTLSGAVATSDDNRGVALFNASDESFREIFEFSSLDDETTVKVDDLTNGTTYNFKVAWVDKWGYTSTLSSATGDVVPELIDTLLDKTSCYLITAGFGKEHYVIDYFRNFRDKFLLQTKLGTMFVNFYYATAPEYAKKLYKIPILRKIVVGMSFILYWLMNYWLYFTIILLLTFSLITLLWKKDLIRKSWS